MTDDRMFIPYNRNVFEGLTKKIIAKCEARGFALSNLTLSFRTNSVRYGFDVKAPNGAVFPVAIMANETSKRTIIVRIDIDYHTEKRGGLSKAPRTFWNRVLNIGDEYGDSVELPVDGTGRDDVDLGIRLEAIVIVGLDDVLRGTLKREGASAAETAMKRKSAA